MKLIGLIACRNEAWVIGASLRAALRWCDSVVVLLHACTDASFDIVSAIDGGAVGRVHMIFREGEWDEMSHRRAMLEHGREWGGTHFAIIDADEILTGNLLPGAIRVEINYLQPGQMLQPRLYNLRGSLGQYHSNGIWGNRWVSLAWKDTGKEHWQGDQFHHREPWGQQWQFVKPIPQGAGGVMHLWGASEARLLAKHRAYKITEALRWPTKTAAELNHTYGLAFAGRESWTFEAVPPKWWDPYRGTCEIDLAAEPWQNQWCTEQIEKHGRERFAGLELWGL